MMGAVLLMASGCEFTTSDFGSGWNRVIMVLGIIAAAVLALFIAYAVVSVFYKGKAVTVKVLKKKETTVLRGNTIGRGTPGSGGGKSDLSRKARRQKTRMRFSKVVVELSDGAKKTLRCNDVVLLDKLVVGKINKVRIRFGEIVKILR
jgi:hypothetical protein